MEPHQGIFTDDTAANDLELKCSNSDGYESELSADNGRKWGTWGKWSPSCPNKSGVCSLKIKFESWAGPGDDTALNDVKMYCC